jgi:hypothetical protein
MATSDEERARALAYRELLRRREAFEKANASRLRGSEAARREVYLDWSPVIRRDRYGDQER